MFFGKTRSLRTPDSRILKSQYLNRIILEKQNDARALWSVIHDAVGKRGKKAREQSPPPENEPGVEEVNNFFTNVAHSALSERFDMDREPDLAAIDNFLTNAPHPPEDVQFSIPRIEHFELMKYIRTLKDSSSGHDSISGRIIKSASESVGFCSAVLKALNNIIETGRYSPHMKVTRVRPIPKRGKEQTLNNLRPIAILSNFDKLLERHIQRHLVSFLTKQDLLYPLQSGFRPGHSCSTILTYYTDSILKRMNEGELSLSLG